MPFGTALVGTTIWGAFPRHGYADADEPDDIPLQMGLHIWIGPGGGVEYTDDLIASSLQIKDEINARSSAEFSIKDAQCIYRFSPGQPVRIMLDTALIFSGLVADIEEELVGGGLGEVNIHRVSCSDWTSLADRHYVTQTYDTSGQNLKDIVTAILEDDSGDPGECIYDYGIRIDPNMDDGPELATCNFDMVQCSEAFDQLSEKTGYWWRIEAVSYDPSTHVEVKYLRFFELSKNPAPFDLNPDTWGEWRRMSVRRSQEKYRNVQYLRAGKATTADLKTDKFKGKASLVTDKSEMSYTLRYEVSPKAKPQIWVNSVQVSAAKVAIRADEGDQDTIDYFYQVESKEITQNNRDGFDALTTADTLEVIYYGLFPMRMQGRNDAEVDARVVLEGGPGIYTDLESDDSITDAEMALERVYGLLRRHCRTPAEVRFETDTNGFRAGQVLNVDLSKHGLSGQFLIQSVDFRSIAEKFFRYTVKAVEGEGDGSWVDFWRKLAQRTRPPSVGDNESLFFVRQPQDGVILGEYVVTVQAIADYTADYYTYAMVGGYCLGKITTDGKVVGPIIGTPYGAG